MINVTLMVGIKYYVHSVPFVCSIVTYSRYITNELHYEEDLQNEIYRVKEKYLEFLGNVQIVNVSHQVVSRVENTPCVYNPL